MVVVLVQVLSVLLLAPTAILFLYNISLALLSVAIRRTPSAPPRTTHDLRFVIVVPAHNEQDVIVNTLMSCMAIEYPADKYDIVVIADNCNDNTPAIVRAHGILCLERHDKSQIGKGYALKWAFDQLLAKDYDAFVVLDADCRIDPRSLEIFANEIAAGEWVLQANDRVSNPDSSAISYAVAVGNIIENQLYYRPKSALGLVVLLRGTGMVFFRRVLERYPWGAFSLAEDKDYSIVLYRNALRIKFLSEVSVSSPFPEKLEQLRAQRLRWTGGGIQVMGARAVRHLKEGLGERKMLYIDMALTLLSQSRPLQLAAVGVLYVCSLLDVRLSGDRFSILLFGFSNALIVGYTVYMLWGVLELGLSLRRFLLLLQTPPALLSLVFIALRGLLRPSVGTWQRTPRK